MKRLVFLWVLGCVTSAILTGQHVPTEKKVYQIAEITGKSPIVDGDISDEAWNGAEWAGDFVQHMPHSGQTPTLQTRFKVCFDDNHIYLAIESFDNAPDSIVRRMTRRDEMDGDLVQVGFDSYHDQRTAFAFVVNAGGAKGDYIISDNGRTEDATWDPIWWVKTSTGTGSWIAEMKIPFSQLRFDNSHTGTWGFNVGRTVYRKDEISFWQPIPPDVQDYVHLFGELHGLKGVKPRKQAEIVPYITTGIERYEADPENPFLPGKNNFLNAGVDAKIGLTNNLTLDLSVNPDFGQVEADPSVVNLSAYETFYEEKRPLFIEGKNIYSFPLKWGGGRSHNLFYSRRIGDRPHHNPRLADNEYANIPEQTSILAAAKLSGKTKNGTSIGILESVTAEEFAIIDQNGERRRETVEPLTNYFAGRIVQDFDKGNTIIGGMLTSTYRDIRADHLSFLPVSATTGGIDFQQYWENRAYNVKFIKYFSHVTGTTDAITRLQRSPSHLFQRPDAAYLELDSSKTSLSGYGGSLQFEKTSGKLNFLAAADWKSPGLEVNDMGYFRIGDEINQVLWASYNFYEPFSIFRQLHLEMGQSSSWDFGGYLAMVGVSSEASAVFSNFWSAEIDMGYRSQLRYNTLLRGGPSILLPGSTSTSFSFSSDERKQLIFEPSVRFSRGFENYEHSDSYSLEIEYKPVNALNLSAEPEFMKSSSVLQYVTQLDINDEHRYIFSSIDQTILSLSLRLNLTLTPELTIQYWGQPFIASGRYYDLKHITESLAVDFRDRFYQYSPEEISFDKISNLYTVQEQRSGMEPYSFSNPDFKISEFLSNLVVRWEYRPGSIVFLVWSQSREEYNSEAAFSLHQSIPEFRNIHPKNVFLLKFSYRIGR